MSSNTKTTPPLLKLPVEVRLNIYSYFMDIVYEDESRFCLPTDQRRSALTFASICRKIRNEFLPLCIEHTEFRLRGMEMVCWPRRTAITFPENDLLSLTRKLSIQLQPEDLWTISCILRDDSSRQLGPRRLWEDVYLNKMTTDHQNCMCRLVHVRNIMACDEEPQTSGLETLVDKVCDAFTRLKRLTSLDLACYPAMKNFEPEHELILRMAGTTLNDLEAITFQSQDVPLDFLGGFPKLKELTFSGFTKSTPAQTLHILKSLRKLESLTLIRTSSFSGYFSGSQEVRTGYDFMTLDVLEKMNPLKHFAILLGSPEVALYTAIFSPYSSKNYIQLATIQALHKHIDSLQTLKIAASVETTTMDKPALESLLSFLATTKTLRGFWIDVYIPGSCAAIDFPSFFPKHILCGGMILAHCGNSLGGDIRRLGFMGLSKDNEEWPTATSPLPGETMQKYWSKIDGVECNREGQDDPESLQQMTFF